MQEKPTLYTYFRSSSAYRVRIVLHYKQIKFISHAIHLLKGQQHSKEYLQKNTMGQVPFFQHDQVGLVQSMSIIEYIDEVFAGPKVLPKDFKSCIIVKQICQMINSGIQPLQNLSVGQRLTVQFQASQEDIKKWNAHWIAKGLTGVERFIQTYAGQYTFGDKITVADAFLVPQVYSAQRYNVDMTGFPYINQIVKNCHLLEAFQKAHPDQQGDSPSQHKKPS